MSSFTPKSILLATLLLLARTAPTLAQDAEASETSTAPSAETTASSDPSDAVLPAGVTSQVFSALNGLPSCAGTCLPAPATESGVPTSGTTDTIFSCLSTQCASLDANDAAVLAQGMQVVAGGCTAILQANGVLTSGTVTAVVLTTQAESATATESATTTDTGASATTAAAATESTAAASAGPTSGASSVSLIPMVTLPTATGTVGVPVLATTTASARTTTAASTNIPTVAIPTFPAAGTTTKAASSANAVRAWTGSALAAVAIVMLLV
ncbi:hypothetical protein HDU96_009579 [Phlyctochytrium bullatum]|nr:hypothetical protein HDU96_009579 [Phlyctochytrium bullatum]